MNFERTSIGGAVLVDLNRDVDECGFFARSRCAQEFAAAGACTGRSVVAGRAALESALLWVMSLADGEHTTQDVAEQSGLAVQDRPRGRRCA